MTTSPTGRAPSKPEFQELPWRTQPRQLGKSWFRWHHAHMRALIEAVNEGREVYWVHSAKQVTLLSIP